MTKEMHEQRDLIMAQIRGEMRPRVIHGSVISPRESSDEWVSAWWKHGHALPNVELRGGALLRRPA